MTERNPLEKSGMQKRRTLYAIRDVVVIFIYPLLSTFLEKLVAGGNVSFVLFVKWVIFWAFGFRLLTSGIKQASDPSLDVSVIKQRDNNLYEIIRRIGIANICLGIGGILSLINEAWRGIMAILACLFFCLDFLRRITSKISSTYEKFKVIEEGIIFLVLLLYLLFKLNHA